MFRIYRIKVGKLALNILWVDRDPCIKVWTVRQKSRFNNYNFAYPAQQAWGLAVWNLTIMVERF